MEISETKTNTGKTEKGTTYVDQEEERRGENILVTGVKGEDVVSYYRGNTRIGHAPTYPGLRYTYTLHLNEPLPETQIPNMVTGWGTNGKKRQESCCAATSLK